MSYAVESLSTLLWTESWLLYLENIYFFSSFNDNWLSKEVEIKVRLKVGSRENGYWEKYSYKGEQRNGAEARREYGNGAEGEGFFVLMIGIITASLYAGKNGPLG